MANKIKVCLDTNIIRDYVTRRNRRSIYLLENLKDKKIPVVASFYCLMEFSDTNKDDLFFYKSIIKEKKTYSEFSSARKQKSLSKQDLTENKELVLGIAGELKFVEWLDLDEKAMVPMLDVSTGTNIDAPDVIHLLTAYLANCSYLVTGDGHFLKYANKFLEEEEESSLKVVTVEQAIKEIGPE